MALNNFREAFDDIVDTLRSNYTLQQEGAGFVNAMWNPARQDDQNRKYKFKVHYFGDEQTDGAGILDRIHYFAIIGKVAPLENFDRDEQEVFDVTDKIINILHRRFSHYYTSVYQKQFVFYSSMTVTSSSRRLTVSLRDGEVGIALFFWAARASVYALASSAVTSHDTSGLSTSSSGSTDTWQEEEDALTTEEKTRAAKLVGLADDQVF